MLKTSPILFIQKTKSPDRCLEQEKNWPDKSSKPYLFFKPIVCEIHKVNVPTHHPLLFREMKNIKKTPRPFWIIGFHLKPLTHHRSAQKKLSTNTRPERPNHSIKALLKHSDKQKQIFKAYVRVTWPIPSTITLWQLCMINWMSLYYEPN